MSLLVRYTLGSADDHDRQTAAMKALVAGLKAEAIPGLTYSCFATDDPEVFLGVLEFPDDATFKAFQASAAFAAYRETVAGILTGPPTTTRLTPVASTRD